MNANLPVSHLSANPSAKTFSGILPDLLERQLVELPDLSCRQSKGHWLLMMDPTIVSVCGYILALLMLFLFGFDILTRGGRRPNVRDPIGHSTLVDVKKVWEVRLK